MTPDLKAVVDEAYRVFGHYELHDTLTACHCNVCMSVVHARALIKTPLRDIPASLLAEYTNSAHTWDEGPVAREMRYFLPRYFELIATNDPPDNMGLDICLRRLGYADWRKKWPHDEVEILERFFDALLLASLPRLELVHWPVGWRLGFDMTDVLTCIITAGGDIDRALAVWDRAPDPEAVIHMASLREDVLQTHARTCLHSAYLDCHKEEADRIGAFLMRPEVDDRIEAAFFAVTDARLQRILSDAMVR